MPIPIASNVAGGTHDGNVTRLAESPLASKYLFGALGTTDTDITAAGSGDTTRAIGVITDEAASAGDPVNVALLGAVPGTQLALAGATISAGDQLTADANSRAVSATTQPAATYHIYGIALKDTAAGELVEFVATPGHTLTVS